ncbi:hypothetical protein P7K49_014973, partial [Saguinus oedipus]
LVQVKHLQDQQEPLTLHPSTPSLQGIVDYEMKKRILQEWEPPLMGKLFLTREQTKNLLK